MHVIKVYKGINERIKIMKQIIKNLMKHTRHAELVSASQTIPLIRHFVSPSPTIGEKEIIYAKHDKNLSTCRLNVLKTDKTPTLSRICKFAFSSLTNSTLSQRERVKYGFTLAEVFSPCRKVKLNFGFTLAEVLITLGIIGVVAALTLPTVISKINKKHYSVALKRVYSTLSQALLMSEQEHGDSTGWPWAPYHKEGLLEWTDEYIFKYIPKIVSCEQSPLKKCPAAESVHCRIVNNMERCVNYNFAYTVNYLLNSGELLYMYMGGNPVDGKSEFIHILVDLNGNKKPNTYGKDIFQFSFGFGFDRNAKLRPYPYINSNDRTILKTKCLEDATYCSQLIFLDNFEFLDDYPY